MAVQLEYANLNLYQKLLKIQNAAAVLQKTKRGFNFNYVPEDEVLAKVTGAMQKYGVMLSVSMIPGSCEIIPREYTIIKDKKPPQEVHDVIVKVEVEYKWTNVDSPTEQISNNWLYIGQMEDASQAFGGGATYGNRYFLMKSLQLATTEADPDEYRSKQRQAVNDEEFEAKRVEEEAAAKLKQIKADIKSIGAEIIAITNNKGTVADVVAKHNNGNKNLSNIKDYSVAEIIKNELLEIKTKLNKGEK